jgi:hypothetical protein
MKISIGLIQLGLTFSIHFQTKQQQLFPLEAKLDQVKKWEKLLLMISLLERISQNR